MAVATGAPDADADAETDADDATVEFIWRKIDANSNGRDDFSLGYLRDVVASGCESRKSKVVVAGFILSSLFFVVPAFR